ncbi:MAG: rhodanese-like domain-containing protein [Salinibacterium amurskyense]
MYVICESGGRSAQAVEWLNTQGFDAVNIEGGTSAWRNAGLPVTKGN